MRPLFDFSLFRLFCYLLGIKKQILKLPVLVLQAAFNLCCDIKRCITRTSSSSRETHSECITKNLKRLVYYYLAKCLLVFVLLKVRILSIRSVSLQSSSITFLFFLFQRQCKVNIPTRRETSCFSLLLVACCQSYKQRAIQPKEGI